MNKISTGKLMTLDIIINKRFVKTSNLFYVTNAKLTQMHSD